MSLNRARSELVLSAWFHSVPLAMVALVVFLGRAKLFLYIILHPGS